MNFVVTGAFEPPTDGRGLIQLLAFDTKDGRTCAKVEAAVDGESAGKILADAREEIEAVHGRHAIVDDEAGIVRQLSLLQKRSGAIESLHKIALRLQEEAERAKNLNIIIDDDDGRRKFLHCETGFTSAQEGHSRNTDSLIVMISSQIDLNHPSVTPARTAKRTSSEILLACILVISFAL